MILKTVVIGLVAGVSLFAQPGPEAQHVPGRILVKFRPEISEERVNHLFRSNGVQSRGVIRDTGVHVLELPPFVNEAALVHVFQGQTEVEFVELDRILYPSSVTPNDPNFINQPNLQTIGVTNAWSTTTGSSSIIIAFVDTGVDGTHPDLVSKMVPGWNINANTSDTSDPKYHGTPMASTAAEATDNGVGSAGICWGCMIMPVRVSDAGGATTVSAIADGITWAANHGARVVSIGWAVTTYPTVTSAAQYLKSKGGVAIAPAGNTGQFDPSADNPDIITVTAITPSNALADFANWGNNIDLVAPNCGYFPAMPGNSYTMNFCGTSASAAMVAGVAGLTLSWRPGLTPAELTRALQLSADDKGAAGWDSTFGWGQVNAERALTVNVSSDTTLPLVSINSPANGASVSGTIAITAAASDNVGVTSVTISAAGTTLCTAAAAPYSCSWNTTAVANGGPYGITATARDAAGNTKSASINASVNNVTADTTPPSVSIGSPANGLTVSGMVSVVANASDNVGVSSVTISAAGTALCTDATAPYSCSWNTTPVANGGPYTITATAVDAAGNSNSASIGVTVNNPDTTAPAVSISAPGNGATVSGNVTITANASDNVGVSSVTISAGGTALCTAATAPYSCSWNTAPVANGGPYTITATALDAAGNSNSASISANVNNDTTGPSVQFLSPQPGAELSGTATVQVVAADPDGVVRMELYVSGKLLATSSTNSLLYRWNTKKFKGARTLETRAYDSRGYLGQATVSVTVR
jgi:hypothetical protein